MGRNASEQFFSEPLTGIENNGIIRGLGVWLSLVERLVRDQEAGGSNPLTPTISSIRSGWGRRMLVFPFCGFKGSGRFRRACSFTIDQTAPLVWQIRFFGFCFFAVRAAENAGSGRVTCILPSGMHRRTSIGFPRRSPRLRSLRESRSADGWRGWFGSLRFPHQSASNSSWCL